MEIIKNGRIKRGAPGRYPWDEWLDGQFRVAVRGQDFESDLKAFRSALYAAASRRNLSVSASLDYDRGAVSFQSAPRQATEVTE